MSAAANKILAAYAAATGTDVNGAAAPSEAAYTAARDVAFERLKSAMADYKSARENAAYNRGLAKYGIANSLQLAFAAEHSAFHRLERAQAEYSALQPAPHPAPNPVTTVPKPAPADVPKAPTARPAPPSTHAAALAAHAVARRDVERIRAEFEAADRRERQAHHAAVAAWNNSQTSKD